MILTMDKNDQKEAVNEVIDRYGENDIYDCIIHSFYEGSMRNSYPGAPGSGDIDDLIDAAAEDSSKIYVLCCEAYERGWDRMHRAAENS